MNGIVLLVDVDLDDLHLMLVRDALQHRRDGVARATPLGPEVHDDLAIGVQDLGLERIGRCVGCHRFLSEGTYTISNA